MMGFAFAQPILRLVRPGVIPSCHCEERSDDAISPEQNPSARDCFASLAMTQRAGQLSATSKPRFVPGRAIIAAYQRLTFG